ncbi:MAG: AAA family ATPase, partial [Lachnospiraceae bacterium]|nr:AAA family ATPase [Lachnospiraceae bacterium]
LTRLAEDRQDCSFTSCIGAMPLGGFVDRRDAVFFYVTGMDSDAFITARFLKGQYEDLQKAEADLVKIVEDLDRGMKKQFSENFVLIQKEFDVVFKELFGGGTGSLELQDPSDPISSDILITSQPPGKRLQNMMQLSGGENALTAIALLFAIQRLKPSPFCLLDEIEAALDETNVVRFANYLKQLTDRTQYVVITHRRGTMNAADTLYGITMQEKGISALVSVNLIEKDLE